MGRLTLYYDSVEELGRLACFKCLFFSLCLNARQPGKVLNRLNARQSEIFTEFPLKDSFELLDGI